MGIETLASVIVKLVKLVLNLIIIILYRVGFAGDFLGVGGTWNLYEEKSSDVEIIASGVFVGYFVYTSISLISTIFSSYENKYTFTDILMNIVGVFLWIAVGATALHYWHGYLSEHKYTYVNSERQVGLALGALSVLNGAVYLIDSVISVIFLIKTKMN